MAEAATAADATKVKGWLGVGSAKAAAKVKAWRLTKTTEIAAAEAGALAEATATAEAITKAAAKGLVSAESAEIKGVSLQTVT